MPIGDCPTFHSVIRVIAINNEFYRKDVLMRLIRETKNRKTDTDDIATAKLFGDVNDWVLQQYGAKPSCYSRESWTRISSSTWLWTCQTECRRLLMPKGSR